MNYSRRTIAAGLFAAAGVLGLSACSKPAGDTTSSSSAAAGTGAAKTAFNIGWSIYVGWMPWPYAQQSGIVKKWADKYGITINIIQVNDYVESINQYTAGKLDGVTVASMDALTIPAAGGKDTSVVVIGDYSNGNDGVVMKGATSLTAIKGQSVNLVELSVSHYLLARALEKSGMKLADVKTVNTGDADIVGAFASPDVKNVVTWNPQLSQVKKAKGATEVFSSAQIPGEILDLLVVDTATLKANPNLGKALVGIWYETVALMVATTPEAKTARDAMATLSGATPEDFASQITTTFLYDTPETGLNAMTSPKLVDAMDRVRQFSFSKGLYGPGATSVDAIGITFPGGKTLGDAANVKLRFDSTYTQMAKDKAV